MFRDKKVVEAVKMDMFASSVPVAIEQFPSKEFFDNPAGWSRNDLASLAAATSKAEFDMLVKNLQDIDPQFNVNDNTKVADAIKAIKPRWCQSANEVVSYVDALTRQSLDDAYAKALEDVNIEGNKDNVQDSAPADVKPE